MRELKIILALLLLTIPFLLSAWTNWKTLSTEHFSIYYQKAWETEAINVLQTMEYYRPYAEMLTGNSKRHIPINLQDMGNLVNGYTDPIGTKIALFCYPPTNDELALCEDWWQLVGTHEYLHMLQMTKASGFPKFLQVTFGNLLYPQLHQPMWMTEGITVFGESKLSPYTGRLNSGSYRPIISALAKENKLPSLTKAAYYSQDTPLAHYYVFGGSFFDYLSNKYGHDKFALLYDDNSSRITAYLNGIFPAFALEKAYRDIYGKPLSVLWSEWQSAEVAKTFIMPHRNLTSYGWNTSDLKSYNGELYFINGRADKTSPSGSFFDYRLKKITPNASDFMLVDSKDKISKARMEKDSTLIIQNTEFPAGFAFANGMLYYTRQETRPGFANNDSEGYGSITELWQMDMTDKSTRKLHSGQFRAFYPLEDGSFLLSEDDATHRSSTLVNILPCCKTRTELLKTDMLISGIIADSSRIFITARDYWKNSSIYEFDAATQALIPLIDTPFWENLTSVEGDTLIYNAVYDGQMGAYQFRLSTGECLRYTGFSDIRNPVTSGNNRDYFISVNAQGYDIYRDDLTLTPYTLPTDQLLPAPYPRLTYESQTKVLDEFPVTKGSYLGNLGHLLVPRMMHIPTIYGTSDSLAFGFALSGNDVVGDFPSWQANVFYDTHQAKVIYSASIQNDFFRPLHQQFYYSNLDDETLSSTQYVTLYKRINYGLNDIAAGFGITTSDDYSRKLWNPYLDANFSWPTGQLNARNYLNYETTEWLPSDRERLGWQGFFQIRQKTSHSSEILSRMTLAYDPEADTDEVFWRLRGYEDGLLANQGATIRTTWYHPIFQVREGLWNPQVYIEDVSLGLFADAALPLENLSEDAQYSTGAELIGEISSFYYLNLNLGVRGCYNRDHKSTIEFIMSTDF